MAGDSALLGAPPLSAQDAAIRKGVLELSPSQLNPIKALPFGPPRPQNYVFETWAPKLQIGTAFAIFFVLSFTITRLAMRRFYTKNLGLDDLFIVPAALGATMYLISIIIQSSAGCLGHHQWDCTYKSLNNFFIWTQVNDPLFYFSVFTAKLSIALQNRRMTLMAGSAWPYVHRVVIGIFVLLIPIITFLEIFTCRPMAVNFNLATLGRDPNPKGIVCLHRSAFSLGIRTLHIITDVMLLSIPIFIIVPLNMAKRRKFRLVAVFAIGGMSTIASIVRNVNIVKNIVDVTWGTHLIYSFDIIDITFALVVANLPALNKLVDPTYLKLKSYVEFSLRSRSDNNTTGGSQNKSGDGSRSYKSRQNGDFMPAPKIEPTASNGSFIPLTDRLGDEEELIFPMVK